MEDHLADIEAMCVDKKYEYLGFGDLEKGRFGIGRMGLNATKDHLQVLKNSLNLFHG